MTDQSWHKLHILCHLNQCWLTHPVSFKSVLDNWLATVDDHPCVTGYVNSCYRDNSLVKKWFVSAASTRTPWFAKPKPTNNNNNNEEQHGSQYWSLKVTALTSQCLGTDSIQPQTQLHHNYHRLQFAVRETDRTNLSQLCLDVKLPVFFGGWTRSTGSNAFEKSNFIA